MKGAVAFFAALAALWLAIGGLVLVVLHTAVVEVVCIELAGVVLALLAAALFVADSRPGCGHGIDCSDTWGGR